MYRAGAPCNKATMGKKKDDAGGRDVSIGECVQVAVRSRKLMPFEAKKGYKPCVSCCQWCLKVMKHL